METLAEAKQYLKNNWEAGVKCPCCGQLVKQYRDKLTSNRAMSLISLWKQSGWTRDYVHITKIERASESGGSFAQLAHWKLIEQEYNTDTQKRRSGNWRITDKGVAFVKGQIRVPAYMLRYNGKCFGFSEQTISMREALGNKFDYHELMSGYSEDQQASLL